MTARRRASTAAVAVLALAALSACEKPAPIVTVVNAGRSVYSEASTYCFDGQSSAQGNCATRASGLTSIAIQGGQPVGIDVAKPLVSRGWVIELSDPSNKSAQPQQSEVQHTHYYSFTAPNLPQGSAVLLTVRALGSGNRPSGEWRFTLTPR